MVDKRFSVNRESPKPYYRCLRIPREKEKGTPFNETELTDKEKIREDPKQDLVGTGTPQVSVVNPSNSHS